MRIITEQPKGYVIESWRKFFYENKVLKKEMRVLKEEVEELKYHNHTLDILGQDLMEEVRVGM